LDLRGVINATDDPSIASLRASVEEAVGDLGLPALDDELARRHRLSDLERTFQGIAYDPDASAKKTFWLVVLSLLVCIVGIVNTMMMAVTERFREIATMKCLGAMDSFILKSFLIESGLVGAIGSALGAVIGLALVLLQISIRYGGSFWSVFPTSDLAIVAGGSLICGLVLAIVGALLPALKAARMHPIEAMRIDA
jgi:putative ABC transport system permease protein